MDAGSGKVEFNLHYYDNIHYTRTLASKYHGFYVSLNVLLWFQGKWALTGVNMAHIFVTRVELVVWGVCFMDAWGAIAVRNTTFTVTKAIHVIALQC